MKAIFSHRLKHLRDNIGVTQKETAAHLNISISLYRYFERESAKNMPSIPTLVGMSFLFHTSTDYLLGLSENQIKESSKVFKFSKSTFVATLRKIRSSQKLTQSEMADKIGLSLRLYQYYESTLSNTFPSYTNLINIAARLDITIDCLLGLND